MSLARKLSLLNIFQVEPSMAASRSPSTILEDSLQMLFAVLERRLEVIELLVKVLKLFLDILALLCYPRADVAGWARHEPIPLNQP